jgi:undecaprenyl-diphosphatase
MAKKIIKLIIAIFFLCILVEMFRYFSYWGLGLSIIVLFIIAFTILVWIIIFFILKFKEKILALIWAIIKYLESTRVWQAFKRKIKQRWPRLYQFNVNRIKNDKPTGLYLTIGIVISFLFFLLFLSIIQDIVFKDPLYLADLRIIYLLHAITSEKLNYLFVFFTNLANSLTIIVGVILAVIYLLFTKNNKVAKYLILSTGSGFLIMSLAKIIFHRSRPIDINLISLPTSYSLPSGHALISICFYGFLAYLLFKNFKNKFSKITILISFLLLTLLIGLSRIYLGVHYPSDVIAGWYLGFVVLAINITLLEIENKFFSKKFKYQLNNKLPLTIFVILFLIFSTISFRQIKIIQPPTILVKTDLAHFLKTESLYSEDLFGQKMEPISFIVIGDEQKIINLFTNASWYQAEKPSFKSFLKLSSAIAKNINYSTAPMIPVFLESKTNNLGFEKSTDKNTSRERHHTRYWRTNYQIDGQGVWVATASFDEGVDLSPIFQLPVHRISPNIDKEREFIIQDLAKTGLTSKYQKIDLVGEVRGINAAGDKFFTNGWAYIIYL